MGRERPPLLMRVVAPLAVGAMRCVQDVRISGAERIPEFGPVLVVSNHTCHLDALSVCMALYRRGRAPVTAGRADLFTAPVLGWALRRLGQIPVYRSDVDHVPADGGSPASSLRAMSDALAAGRALVVFPESTFTRDPDGWPMRGKTGSARLALAHPDAVVLPVAHWGNRRLIHPWTGDIGWRRMGRRRTRLDVRIGEPLDLSDYAGREVTHELLTEMTEAIMAAITKELVELRPADVAAGRGPRERRWDRRVDGDPYRDVDAANSQAVRRRLERREKEAEGPALRHRPARPPARRGSRDHFRRSTTSRVGFSKTMRR